MDTPNPAASGMSAKRLEQLTQYMDKQVEGDRLPGILTAIYRKGHLAHKSLHGCMDIASGKPVQEDTIFRIYSMTKPITSLAVMMLLEEGHIHIDDPIADFIPAFNNSKVSIEGGRTVEQESPISIRHLLTHTSGVSAGGHAGNDVTLKDYVEAIASSPLQFQPGTTWQYSVATDVLGYLVEVVSGQPFAEYLADHIFKPLEMEDTAFHVAANKLSRLMTPYRSDNLTDPVNNDQIHDFTRPTLSPRGAAGLTSTADDYLKFCICLLNGGDPIIGRKTLAWMTSNHLLPHQHPYTLGTRTDYGYGFGLGFRVALDVGQARTMTSIGEYGWSGMLKTVFWIDPQEELIGLFMTQHQPTAVYPLHNIFRNLVYQAIVD